jgi:hypothetical protein
MRLRTAESLLSIGSVIGSNAILPAFVQSPDRNPPVLGNEADQLLPNVFDIVVLLKETDVRLYGFFGRLAGGRVLASL